MDDDLRRVYHCIEQWLGIKAREFGDSRQEQVSDEIARTPHLIHPVLFSACDAMHSSLLARLLSGKEPFESPPPRSYSYPWYDLVEQGFANDVEAHFDNGQISINQNSTQWEVESVESEWKYIVHCLTNNKRYVLSCVSVNSGYVWRLDELKGN